MANTQAFVDHVVDLLSLAGPVEVRRMFGGHGVYVGDAMFGLVDDDELFLKTDEVTRARFVAAGCRTWTYERRDGTVKETSYFQPPDDAHEDAEAMLPWARLGVEAALRKRAAKVAEGRAKESRRAAKTAAAAARRGGRRGADVRRGGSVGARGGKRPRPRAR
jgi:DNA transformation protein and related proteins